MVPDGQPIPDRFLIQATFSGARVVGPSTWIAIVGSSGDASAGSVSLKGIGLASISSLVLVEFTNVDLSDSLADYRLGDEVRVAVRVNEWGDFAGGSVGDSRTGTAVNLRGGLQRFHDGLVGAKDDDFAFFRADERLLIEAVMLKPPESFGAAMEISLTSMKPTVGSP